CPAVHDGAGTAPGSGTARVTQAAADGDGHTPPPVPTACAHKTGQAPIPGGLPSSSGCRGPVPTAVPSSPAALPPHPRGQFVGKGGPRHPRVPAGNRFPARPFSFGPRLLPVG